MREAKESRGRRVGLLLFIVAQAELRLKKGDGDVYGIQVCSGNSLLIVFSFNLDLMRPVFRALLSQRVPSC